jgi:hypothetical protein
MEPIRAPRQRRLPILSLLLALDAFGLGGLLTLLVVNRLLNNQLDVYLSHSFVAAATILDFMEDLIPYYVIYGGTLLALVLTTFIAWMWSKTKSPLLRYGVVLSVLILVTTGAWILLARGTGAPPVPPMTPTPVP